MGGVPHPGFGSSFQPCIHKICLCGLRPIVRVLGSVPRGTTEEGSFFGKQRRAGATFTDISPSERTGPDAEPTDTPALLWALSIPGFEGSVASERIKTIKNTTIVFFEIGVGKSLAPPIRQPHDALVESSSVGKFQMSRPASNPSPGLRDGVSTAN